MRTRRRLQYTRRLLTGVATFAPFGRQLGCRRTGGSDSARYCYSVWLRHLRTASMNGLRVPPESVGELGPGDSIATGVAVLLSGSSYYCAFDVVRYASAEMNAAMTEEVINLFLERHPIPDDREFPLVHPKLDSYEFPHDILTDELLAESLAPARLDAVRSAVRDVATGTGSDRDGVMLSYQPDWMAANDAPARQLDFVFSQAVLEHVDQVPETHSALYGWLRDGGIASHDIDLASHSFARDWNGHWVYSDFEWRLIRGRRPYAINRASCSDHISYLRSAGFEILESQPDKAHSSLRPNDLAPRFASLSGDDLETASLFVQARKPPGREPPASRRQSGTVAPRAGLSDAAPQKGFSIASLLLGSSSSCAKSHL